MRQHIMGANTFRLVMAAARALWFIDQVERGMTFTLCRYRPWYRQMVAPSQLDVVWACRETLQEGGIFPIPRFSPDLAACRRELFDHRLRRIVHLAYEQKIQNRRLRSNTQFYRHVARMLTA